MLSVSGFLAWTKTAGPGDAITYHEGLLSEDRTSGPSPLPEKARAELHRLAGRAMGMAVSGELLLVQRRIEPGRIAYIAIKPKDPQPRRTWL
jgi:hypothetical protein